MWDTWGMHLPKTKRRTKRGMSLSQDALAQVELEPRETETATLEAISHTASQENSETAHDNFSFFDLFDLFFLEIG